jgi:hypothetical protein
MRHTLCLAMAAAMVMPSTCWTAESGVSNFAYSIFVGTGVYEINDRTIYVFRAPLSFDLTEIDVDNDHIMRVRLLLPVVVGMTQFDDDDIEDFNAEDIQSFSIVPGLEFPIALSSEWQLSPFAQYGVGVDAKSDYESTIWGTGVRTRWQPGSAPNWLVGGEFLWAGNNPRDDRSTTDFTRWGLGTEYRLGTEQVLMGRKLSWHFRLMRWYFSDVVEFEQPMKVEELNSTTEVGVSVGVNKPFNILGYQARQVGIGYEWADNFRAIKFFTTFPF